MTPARLIEQTGSYPTTFSEHHPPIVTVEPGETVTIRTLDAFFNRVTTPEHKPSELCPMPNVNPVTGPIVVEGAEPGDALRVRFEAIEVDRDFAVTALIPNFGGLTRTTHTALLHPPLPERVRIMPIRDGEVHFSERVRLPVEPFVGTVGVAPVGEAIASVVPDQHGGNMDCVETCAGHTLILPVQVAGAHFFVGDAHAAQGDGEVTGVAAEVPARVRVTFELEKGRAPGWPRLESDAWLMATGSARPLEDAARIAWCELIDWLVADFGFERLEAYELLGQVGRLRVGNMVDPNYTVVAKVPRRYVAQR